MLKQNTLMEIVFILSLLSILAAGFPSSTCDSSCSFTLVESTPMNLSYPSGPRHLSTYEAHKRLIGLAKASIHISSFYWTLHGSDTTFSDSSSYQGEDIFNKLQQIARAKSIDLKIAQNVSNADTEQLAKDGAQVRTLDFERLVGAGVLHTKMWIVDDTHLYVGSANFDWRSYTQVKEIGVLVENCNCLVKDAAKIFEIYWYLGQPNVTVPKMWPSQYSTSINRGNPIPVPYNNSKGLVYFSSSPPMFCPQGRTVDIDAILHVIHSAREFVYISVMDYSPSFLYTPQQQFWPVIDDALRSVAINKRVKVFLMASKWQHTMPDMYSYLKSLNSLDRLKGGKVNIEVKLFSVPSYTPDERKIPYSRVSHDKYMVTDQHAYIGTSNWSADYFVSTGGVGFVLNQSKHNTTAQGTRHKTSQRKSDLRQDLEDTFLRDWFSNFTQRI